MTAATNTETKTTNTHNSMISIR